MKTARGKIMNVDEMMGPPKGVSWEPREDITAYELALCVPVFLVAGAHHLDSIIKTLPEGARRHFKIGD